MTARPRLQSARFVNVVFGRIIKLLVRAQVLPEKPPFDPAKPVCFMLESDAPSNIVILQQVCRAHGFPMPLALLPAGDDGPLLRSTIPLQRLRGVFVRRTDLRTHLDQLGALIAAVETGVFEDVQLVPVSIFLGRAPDKETGLWRILFSENWPVAGRFRRALSLLIHGRSTLVQFSRPISLEAGIAEALGRQRLVRKISRVLRVHFRRVRTSVIGPDLSHRRTLVDGILRAPQVREAIHKVARRDGISVQQAQRRARDYALEIAADYSYPVVRLFYRFLTWFWNQIYDGVEVHHLEHLTAVKEGTEIIYVPCHRSHIDYLLLSYIVYVNGIVIPHIAAGVNLNLPIVGSILRRGGAFFLRRSFRAKPLYSAVFSEYFETIFAKGVPIEYFIEGTRSRTGRPLEPRTGMLAMTVRSYLAHRERPTVFVPVYIGYERLVEGGAYLGELSGGKKKRETLGGLLRSYRVLRQQYGRVHVCFGRPIRLDEHLDTVEPTWRDGPAAEKPAWLPTAVSSLAHRVLTNINEAANINPINLVALAILASPKNAMSEEDLEAHIALYQGLFASLPPSSLVTCSRATAGEVIRHAERLSVLQRRSHPLGDVLSCDERGAFLLSYFRNNVIHAATVYSWCACVFMNNMSFSRKELLRLGRVLHPFLRSERFLHLDDEAFAEACNRCLELYVERGLLLGSGEADMLRRPPGGSVEAYHLRLLGQNVFSSLERYYLVVALLVRHGSGALTGTELEGLCQLTAQRLSMLHMLETPDFFDRHLFGQFIQRLKDREVISADGEGKLVFTTRLHAILDDAKAILSKDVRHNILKASPDRVLGARRDAA